MSFCKKWRDQQVGQTCDKARKTSASPALLRLDSTGEVTSVSPTPSRKMCRGRKNGCCRSSQDRQNNLSPLKSVVNGFSMSTVIDTASSYLTTASNYIESICPYKTSTNLVGSRSSYTPDIDCDQLLQNDKMMGKENWRKGDRPLGQCDSIDNNVTQGYPKTWRKDFLGALQSTVFNKDSQIPANMKSDKYIPPPIKLRLMRESQCYGLHRDSNLTPYNAMLLQRSKARYMNCVHQNGRVHKRHDGRASDSTTAEEKQSSNNLIESEISAGTENTQLEISKDIIKESATNPKVQIKSEDLIVEESNSETEQKETPDWFEYENETENVIPIEVKASIIEDCSENGLNVPPAKTAPSNNENLDRHLHSWYSMENDSEVRKTDIVEHIQVHCVSSQALCDELMENKLQTEKISNTDNGSEPKKVSNSPQSDFDINAKERNNTHHKQQDDQCKKKELFSVLYVRNCNGGKRRSSAQKRSRHKAQKDAANNCDKTSKSLRHSDARHPNSSVAFILGLDRDNKERCFSFQIDCDDDADDDDIDWSSCDENDQSDDFDDLDDIQFMSPLRNLVNFQVTCSVPSMPSSPPYHNSALQRINLEWELNVAVRETESKKKSQSSKNVHFKDDKQLSKVHHMVAWSYAYQAARKGPWEEIARDRGRFQRRITDGEKLLKPILDLNHRLQVFKERFEKCD